MGLWKWHDLFVYAAEDASVRDCMEHGLRRCEKRKRVDGLWIRAVDRRLRQRAHGAVAWHEVGAGDHTRLPKGALNTFLVVRPFILQRRLVGHGADPRVGGVAAPPEGVAVAPGGVTAAVVEAGAEMGAVLDREQLPLPVFRGALAAKTDRGRDRPLGATLPARALQHSEVAVGRSRVAETPQKGAPRKASVPPALSVETAETDTEGGEPRVALAPIAAALPS